MSSAKINKSYIRALAKQLGINRISKDTYPVIQTLGETYINYLLKEAYEFTRYRKASTLSDNDVNAAVKRTT